MIRRHEGKLSNRLKVLLKVLWIEVEKVLARGLRSVERGLAPPLYRSWVTNRYSSFSVDTKPGTGGVPSYLQVEFQCRGCAR
jgi:hypothetical protein